MKRFITVLWIMCLVCLLIPAMAEDASDISGTDWVSPEDGYLAKWENLGWGIPEYLALCPADPEGNPIYVDHTDIDWTISNSGTGYAIRLSYHLYPEEEPEPDLYILPVAMSVERYNELMSDMSSKDKKTMTIYKRVSYQDVSEWFNAREMLTYFPALETEDLYIPGNAIPNSGVVTASQLKGVEEKLMKYGYTKEDFEKDRAYATVNPAYLLTPHARKYITYEFLDAASSPPLTRSRVLQLAALIDTINNDIVVHCIRPEGEPVPVDGLIHETYEVDGTIFDIALNEWNSWPESGVVELTVTPQ